MYTTCRLGVLSSEISKHSKISPPPSLRSHLTSSPMGEITVNANLVGNECISALYCMQMLICAQELHVNASLVGNECISALYCMQMLICVQELHDKMLCSTCRQWSLSAGQ